MKRRDFAAALGAAALLPRVAWGQDASWADVEAKARKEGTVTLYHNFFPTGTRGIVQAFNKQYPDITLRDVRLPSSQFYLRFAAEMAAARIGADVSLNSMDDTIVDWRKKNWIAQWKPPEAPAIPASMSIDSAIWGVQAIRHIYAYNKQRVPAAARPTEWMDLFDPRWKGKIGMDAPWRSVGPLLCMKFIETTFHIDTAERFKSQDLRFFDGSAGVLQGLIRGDIQIGQLADYVLSQALEDGAPIQPVYPKSGVAFVTNVVFVTEGAPNPNAARVLANWFMSEPGEEALQTFSGSPGVRNGIAPHKLLPSNKDLNLTDGRTILSREDSDKLIAEWRRVFNVT